MVLSQKHRSSIYSGLAPVIGEEEADALLSQLPTRIGDEPVTRDVLRAEMAELRTELKGDMADLRTELKGDMADLRTELKDDTAGIRTELHDQMRQMAMWVVGAIIAALLGGMGLAAGIGSALS